MKQYYLKPERLEEVLFLIQELGLGKTPNLQIGSDRLGDAPKSADSWFDLAQQHREFFNCTEKDTIRLSLRKHQRSEIGEWQPLATETVQILVETALAIHKSQVERVNAWKLWLTMATASVAAILGILEALNVIN